MSRALVRSLAVSTCLALGLITLGPVGCRKQDMKALEIPSEGLALHYTLVAGASYDGKVERRETIAARDGRFNRNLKFTVKLSVTAVDEAGNARVAATISNIAIDWTIPGIPMSMDEFNANAKKMLDNVTIRFNVDSHGRVSDIPAPPANLDEATVGVLDSLIEGLTSAFYLLPDKPMKAGETWDDSDSRGREGKLGKYVEETSHGALIGLFEQTEPKQRFAQLKIDQDRSETTTTKSGSTSTRVRSATTVHFDVDADYMTSIDSTMTSTQGPNTTTVQFKATWVQASKGSGAAPSGPEPVIQKISDPCDNDYVGPEDCVDPCNSNYMGEESCSAPESDSASDAPASAPALGASDSSTTTG